MAVRTTPIWLADIREEIAGIRSVTAGQSPDDFASSWVTKRAVEHALLIIAEAAKHLPAELKERHPEVPWQRIHGLGNMLRHEYRRIDPDILWSVVSDHIDPLDEAVAAMQERSPKT
ncbi:MAG: HepT-like ribonuclease domain-containing protein [Tardiphaga sp.]